MGTSTWAGCDGVDGTLHIDPCSILSRSFFPNCTDKVNRLAVKRPIGITMQMRGSPVVLQADLLHVDREVWQAPAQRVPSQPQHAQRRRTHKRRQLAGQTPVLLHTRTPMYDQSQSLCCALSSTKGWAGVRSCFAPRDRDTLVFTNSYSRQWHHASKRRQLARQTPLCALPDTKHGIITMPASAHQSHQTDPHVLLHTQDTKMGLAPDFMHGTMNVRMSNRQLQVGKH
jgi:hypothetical protein